MMKFSIRVILFIIPILITAFSMEILLRHIPNDYLYKKEYMDKHANEIETLILGSSHSFRGLNPKYFYSKTFNASYISQSLNYDYEIFKKYQDSFTNLKTIILPISYFTLYSKLENGIEAWRVKNYLIYYKLFPLKNIFNYSEILSNTMKVNINRLELYYIKEETNMTCTELGWGGISNTNKNKNLVTSGKTAAQRHTIDDLNKVQDVFNENIRILHSMISWSREKNIKILFFTPPAFKTYRNDLNPKQLNLTITTMNKIVSESENCTYINLLNDSIFVANDFYDADHLSEIGAEKLSKLINKIVNKSKARTHNIGLVNVSRIKHLYKTQQW